MVLILTLAPISGAHFNPAVTLAMSVTGQMPPGDAAVYVASQMGGALRGRGFGANLMFGLPMFFASNHARHGAAQLWSEVVATFGLMFVIWGCSRFRPSATACAVGSLHHCGVLVYRIHVIREPRSNALARSSSDTFAGIRPTDTPAFIAAQLKPELLAAN